MYRIVVNGAEVPAESPCETWGELLDWLDRRSAHQGQLVTDVRLDGVEWPAFRDPEIAGQPIQQAVVVEVGTSEPRQLLASTLDQAHAAATALGEAAAGIGTALRGFSVSGANRDLAEFATTLGTLVTIATAVSAAMGVNLNEVGVDGRTGRHLVDDLAGYAQAVIAAQDQQDWITVADVVEYDIAPALAQWPALFQALRALVDTNPPA